jgi:hypothetical protein
VNAQTWAGLSNFYNLNSFIVLLLRWCSTHNFILKLPHVISQDSQDAMPSLLQVQQGLPLLKV